MKTIALTFAGLSALLLAPALQAVELHTGLSYQTQNQANTSWLVDAQASHSSDSVAAVQVDNLPPIPHAGMPLFHSTYMSGGTAAQASGGLSSFLSLTAGGQLASSAIWRDSFTNGSASNQAYLLDFAFGGFSAGLGGWTADHSQRDYRAQFELSIHVDGQLLLQGSQTVIWSQGQLSLVKSGFDFGSGSLEAPGHPEGEAYYHLSDYQGQLALGSFAAGQSFQIEYRLDAAVFWQDPAGCAYECGSVSLTINDPFASGGSLQVSAVPEPGSQAMLLGGALLVGWTLRRRRLAR